MSAPSAIILAAGKGTRMNSDLPKVAHKVCGRAMVAWVVDACLDAGCERVVVVVGHGREHVREALTGIAHAAARVEYVVQSEQLGTGHAVQCAAEVFTPEREAEGNPVFVLAGDGPLIRAETLKHILDVHKRRHAAATLATSVLRDPSGYGRIHRDAKGRFLAIVEDKDATPEQKAIREVNPSYYCFDARALFDALSRVQRNEKSGEFYITDVPRLLIDAGRRVEVIDAVPPEDVLSINTPAQLADVERILHQRLAGHARTPAARSAQHGMG